jgi:hypothetical protein
VQQPFSSSARIIAISLAGALLPSLMAGRRPSEHSRAPRFHDWTTHHMVYPQTGTLSSLRSAESDPRALFRWRETEEEQFRNFFEFRRHRGPHRRPDNLHRDWSISLGAGTVAAGQFPAKFSFDAAAPPDCINDFVVFPVNVNGSGTQPNLVGFNRLYSGTAGGNGICNRTASDSDLGTSATVLWSYNIHAIAAGAAVPGSPALSLDGAKVAFVESAAGSAAHFHVLAWNSGDGQDATDLQNTLLPKAITTFSTTAPAAGTGAATDLALGTATDTISSPFVDYVRDVAYVGNDQGTLYRIKNVFCTDTCTTAAPNLDESWGSGGAVTVGSGSCAGTSKSTLTGPILDFVTLNVFVGCADGKVYGFTSSGAPLDTPSIVVGNGSATGGVVESPIVDGVNGFIYAVAGTGAAGTSAVLVQATTSLGGPCAGGTLCVANVGNPGVHNAYSPALNDNYFTSETSADWLIYMGGFTGTSDALTLYGASFNASRVMTTGTPTNTLNIPVVSGEFAPLTEFKNGATDWLFGGILQNSFANLGSFNINTFPSRPTNLILEGSGPSGMIIDNSSASTQASNIYFAIQSTNTAVKLTQAGFQ